MRTEGVYTYLCHQCQTLFAVVSRFAVSEDFLEKLKCPKCSSSADIYGEGFLKHKEYEELSKELTIEENVVAEAAETLPELLRVEHISNYLNVSNRVAYEYMNRPDFPVIVLGRSKRVFKKDFLDWLKRNMN